MFIKPGSDLRGANLRNADLHCLNLSRVNLTNAQLHDANLQGANLAGANLTNAQLQDANLQGANLAGANLTNAQLQDANLQGATLPIIFGTAAEKISKALTWSNDFDGTSRDFQISVEHNLSDDWRPARSRIGGLFHKLMRRHRTAHNRRSHSMSQADREDEILKVVGAGYNGYGPLAKELNPRREHEIRFHQGTRQPWHGTHHH
jgi:hypothetical protein